MNRPLEKIRILDLTQVIAGSYGAMILADLGAEVIKIEPPTGDIIRDGAGHRVGGERVGYLSFNRNKKSVVLDLKKEEGRDIFLELVKKADVVFDNFRAGVLERLGLGFETLKAQNPLIISCSISGYGEDGPYRDRAAYDLVVQAITGAMSLTGEEGRPPVRMGIAVADHAAGMFAATGILTGVIARNATGQGQRITTSLFEAMLSLLSYEGGYYLAGGEIPKPRGSGHENNVPYQAFPTKDSHIVVAIRGNTFWRELCEALQVEELLTDPRFAKAIERKKNKKLVLEKLEAIFKTKTTEEWEKILSEKDVPSGPVNRLDKALTNPQVFAREMVIKSTSREGHSVQLMGNPLKIPTLPCKVYNYPPKLGEHTNQVLSELLHYSEEKLNDLREKGVIK
jgi:CoA:oxalate CoA-transferase